MKTHILTHLAPPAVGPYSQAVRAGDLLFVSGQLPLDPNTGQLVPGNVSAQTKRIMQNLLAIIEEAGFTPGDVVKTTCLLADMSDFPQFNSAYGEYFTDKPPARETYQVAALPLGARVEISAICARQPKRRPAPSPCP